MDDWLYGEMVVNQSQSDRAFLMSLFGACLFNVLYCTAWYLLDTLREKLQNMEKAWHIEIFNKMG